METVAARTNRLAYDNCFSGDPGRIDADFERHQAVTPEQLIAVAEGYLLEKPYVALSCVPLSKTELAACGRSSDQERAEVELDRSQIPTPKPKRLFQAPTIWRSDVDQGPRIVGTPFTKLPLTRLSVSLPAGRLLESQDKLGLSSLTAEMMEEGTQRLRSTELQDELDGLGAEFYVIPEDDGCRLELAVLNQHFETAVDLLGEVLREPRLDEEDFQRLKRQRLVDIQSRRDRVGEVASEAFAALVHGRENIKGSPHLGTPESVDSMTLEDVRSFWRDNYRLADGTLCMVGERSAEDSRLLFAERLQGLAPAQGDEIAGHTAPVLGPEAISLYVVNKPGAAQSELRIGHKGVARTDPDFFGLHVLNYILGGSFTSRLNLNLREDKGYTYGVNSGFSGGRTPGSFVVRCAVETAVTGPALKEVLSELQRIHTGVEEHEVDLCRRAISQAMARSLESARARLSMLESITRYGLPDDYIAKRMQWLERASAKQLDDLAARYLEKDRLICLVAGDLEKIRGPLEELGIGAVQEMALELEPV